MKSYEAMQTLLPGSVGDAGGALIPGLTPRPITLGGRRGVSAAIRGGESDPSQAGNRELPVPADVTQLDRFRRENRVDLAGLKTWLKRRRGNRLMLLVLDTNRWNRSIRPGRYNGEMSPASFNFATKCWMVISIRSVAITYCQIGHKKNTHASLRYGCTYGSVMSLVV